MTAAIPAPAPKGRVAAFFSRLIHGDGEHAAGSGSLPGVDVSNWNGEPKDWKQSAGRISWAAVKATEVTFKGGKLTAFANADAPADLAFLRQSGKGVLHYLFAHPDTPVQATGQMFAARVRDLGIRDDEGIVIDLEVSAGRTPAQVASWTRDLTAYLERELDRPVIIYTFLSFAQEGNCAGLGSRMLWMADPSSPAGHPRIPKPWRRWAFHQWSVSGGLDRDVANFATLADMKAAIGKKERTKVVVADGTESLARLAGKHGASAARALHLTARASDAWQGEMHDFLNGVFSGKVDPTAPLKKGVKVTVPVPK